MSPFFFLSFYASLHQIGQTLPILKSVLFVLQYIHLKWIYRLVQSRLEIEQKKNAHDI